MQASGRREQRVWDRLAISMRDAPGDFNARAGRVIQTRTPVYLSRLRKRPLCYFLGTDIYIFFLFKG